jgi:hypothetical protein
MSTILTDISDISSPQVDLTQEVNRTSYAYRWNIIPPSTKLSPYVQNLSHRLNALGDNFYFIKFILRKHRLSNSFHRQYCDAFQSWSLKEVFEVPRDHFKTTIGSVGMPIWWALPFNDRDERMMRALGYGDEWIAWMHRAHDQNTRTLIAMETITNAWKVGKKISSEYKNNNFFKQLFPEILPNTSCQWTADTMTHLRDYTKGDANQGEGTYEFTGVDAALQSKHYRRLVFDDLYGKDALKSELVALSTWEWMQLAVGAFDSDPTNPDMECDEVVNGNRWSFHDLNWKIKKELPYFKFHTHDAEGGCCELHPPGIPIFPEEWSMVKLLRMRQRLGEYFYSCQFRNRPIPPGGNTFKSEWLRHYVLISTTISKAAPGWKQININIPMSESGSFGTQGYQIVPHEDMVSKRHMTVRHEMNNGVLPKDIATSNLTKMLMIDPNHKGETGRANHALMLLGINRDPFNLYILDGRADTCSREDIMHHAYVMAEKWRIREIWVEISAGQTWCKTAFEIEDKLRSSLGKWYFHQINEFKDNRSDNAKSDRIEDAEPFFRRGQIWVCQNDQTGFTQKFMEEYNEYPHCATRDILDILGHGLQNLDLSRMSEPEMDGFILQQQKQAMMLHAGRNSVTGY